jgi:hypothetical protein
VMGLVAVPMGASGLGLLFLPRPIFYF